MRLTGLAVSNWQGLLSAEQLGGCAPQAAIGEWRALADEKPGFECSFREDRDPFFKMKTVGEEGALQNLLECSQVAANGLISAKAL